MEWVLMQSAEITLRWGDPEPVVVVFVGDQPTVKRGKETFSPTTGKVIMATEDTTWEWKFPRGPVSEALLWIDRQGRRWVKVHWRYSD